MLFPWWLTKSELLKYPTTIVLFLLSLFFLLILPPVSEKFMNQVESEMNTKNFLQVQSFEYREFLKSEKLEEYEDIESVWLGRNYDSSKVNLYWTQISFRDPDFVTKYKSIKHYPDEVMYNHWLATWDQFLVNQKVQWTTFFGLSALGNKWTHYLTYQFVHSGFLHFFSNILLLILFGIAAEKLVGGFAVAFVYIVTGVFGALFYEWSHGINTAPLVGASASVSGLMAFYFLMEQRKNLRYFYFFGPIEGFYGEIYLRKEWMIPLLFLNDISEIYSTPFWQLSVAHTAHLGAVGAGFFIAIIWKILKFPTHTIVQTNFEEEFNILSI